MHKEPVTPWNTPYETVILRKVRHKPENNKACMLEQENCTEAGNDSSTKPEDAEKEEIPLVISPNLS